MLPWNPDDLFDDESYRAAGLDDWFDVFRSGRRNVVALHALARRVQTRRMTDGDKDAARGSRQARDLLAHAASSIAEDLPLLPWLRSEHFAVGDGVAMHLGGTPGSEHVAWVSGRVVRVSKEARPAWRFAPKTSGWYWRIEIAPVVPLRAGESETLACTTTEPRVLLEDELEVLRALHGVDARFAACWSGASRRTWNPLWCIERGLEARDRGRPIPAGGRWIRFPRSRPDARPLGRP